MKPDYFGLNDNAYGIYLSVASVPSKGKSSAWCPQQCGSVHPTRSSRDAGPSFCRDALPQLGWMVDEWLLMLSTLQTSAAVSANGLDAPGRLPTLQTSTDICWRYFVNKWGLKRDSECWWDDEWSIINFNIKELLLKFQAQILTFRLLFLEPVLHYERVVG